MIDALVRCHSDHSGQHSGSALFSSKASTHPLHPDHHPVSRDAQSLRHQKLKQRQIDKISVHKYN